MTMATKFGGFTSATVIKLLLSTIKLPSESSAMTLRLGKAAVSPSANGIQSPMLQPKKFAPSRLKSDQKAVFDYRRQKFQTIIALHQSTSPLNKRTMGWL